MDYAILHDYVGVVAVFETGKFGSLETDNRSGLPLRSKPSTDQNHNYSVELTDSGRGPLTCCLRG